MEYTLCELFDFLVYTGLIKDVSVTNTEVDSYTLARYNEFKDMCYTVDIKELKDAADENESLRDYVSYLENKVNELTVSREEN